MEKRHHDFHRALIAYCKSPRLLEIAGQLYIETQRYRLPSLIGRVAEKHARDVPKEHKEIMDAALRRSESALDLLAAHYRKTSEIISTSADWGDEK